MASRSAFFTVVLLTAVIYVFAIAFTQLTEGTEVGELYFRKVPMSMKTLLLHGCFGEDLPDVTNALGDESLFLGGLLIVFVMIASLTIMNMLIGVLCQVVTVVATLEKEEREGSFVRDHLQSLWDGSGLDADGNGNICRTEFDLLMQTPEAARSLYEVGVDVYGLVEIAEIIFKDGIELTFPDFMELVLSLRGSNHASVKDIVDLRKFMFVEMENLKDQIIDEVMGSLQKTFAMLRLRGQEQR